MKISTMTKKELSQAIRNELKANGYNSKEISVSVKPALYDTSIRVIIKNITIHISAIEKICNKYEEIRRCERTNEILSGCNTYVNASYDYCAMSDFEATKYKNAEIIYNSAMSELESGFGKRIAENGNKQLYFMRGCSQYPLHQAVICENGKFDYKKIDFNNHYGLARALARFELHGQF